MNREQMLLDLLAVIHRDGGHYTEEFGLEKSYEFATEIVINNARVVESLNDAIFSTSGLTTVGVAGPLYDTGFGTSSGTTI